MKAAAGDARKSAAPATSPGSPQRPSGVRDADRFVAHRVVAQRRGQRRGDPAGRDRIDADAVRGVGDRQRLGQLGDAALARGIGRHQAAAEEAQHRGEVDDRAAAAFGEAAARGGADALAAVQVDVDDVGEDLGRVLLAAPDHAGAMDDDVQARLRADQRVDGGAVADVEQRRLADRRRAPLDLGHGRAGHEHARAMGDEGRGDAGADAAGGADDEDVAAGEEVG